MDQWLLLMIALALVAIAVLVLLIWQRRRTAEPPPSPGRPQSPEMIEMQVQDRNGEMVATAAMDQADAPQADRRRWLAGRLLWIGGGVVAALALLAGGLLWLAPGWIEQRTAGQFIVLVAPFDDGGDGQTGRSVAAELMHVLQAQAGNQLVVEALDERPADARAALDLARARQADVVIYGGVLAGAMLDSPALTPRLIYAPSGPYAPYAWDGYSGRFAMPRSYTLADEPINGQAVLPRYLLALAAYGSGEADLAFDTFDRLLAEYPLDPALPRAVRGNVLWARGIYDQAADEYRRALALPSDEQALLANNLGAILIDAGDGAALAALSETARLLAGQDLGELRFNLGLVALREDRFAAAATELEQARNLLPPNVSLLLALSQSYRQTGRLADAEAALAAAGRQLGADVAAVPGGLQPLARLRLDAALSEERGLLALARRLNSRGPLAWELDLAPPSAPNPPADARDALRTAIAREAELVNAWNRRATAEAAALPGGGQVASGQERRGKATIERMRYHLGSVLVEDGRGRDPGRRGMFAGTMDVLFGTGTPLGDGVRQLQSVIASEPDYVDAMVALGRAFRYQRLYDQASQQFDRALQLAPDRPEPYFNRGVVALETGNRDAARPLFTQALTIDDAYFPARSYLARLAEENNDWVTALEHRRTLAKQRPGADTALDLAAALRRSGPAGYAEAELVLQPLVASNNLAALVEQGRLYRAAGHLDEAVAVLRDARQIDGRSADAAYELGLALIDSGDPRAAAEQLRAAVNNDAGHVAARLALGDLYMGPLQQPAQATAEYEAALKQASLDSTRLVQIGNALLANDQPAQAAEAFRKALARQPADPRIHQRLADAYLAQNNLSGTTQEEQRVLELTGDTANPELRALRATALAGLGDVARLSGQSSQASAYYNQALALDPDQVHAALGLGLLAVGQGNWAVARGHFAAAAALPMGQSDARTQFWLAEALLRQPDLARAIDAYNRALALQPVFPEALLGLAQAQYGTSNLAGALESLRTALQQRPRYAEALLFQGKLLQEQGQTGDALAAYTTSIDANPRIPETFYRRGLIYIQRLDYDRAIRDLRRATDLQPNFPEAYYWLGRAYFAQNQLNPALGSFKRAVDLAGSYPEARLYQGMVEVALERHDEAIASFQAVVAADGSGAWGARARTELAQLQ